MVQLQSPEEFAALLTEMGDGVPNTEQYRRMSGLVLSSPDASKLARMDPFAPGYKAAAMELYLTLRGRTEQGYVAQRDEAPAGQLPRNLWTELIPWAFRDARMVSEHLLAWGHILSHLNLKPGGSVLEYGPGSGQLLLMLARMGYVACGVDIDEVALASIQGQASHLDVPVATERAEFGQGFDGRRFDTILFYEAFHHAFDFDELLIHLHDRINPGGRVVLCGEPVVGGICDTLPYPWGPRLDALSVFCIQRFGWMELGFTHDYLMKIARATGWTATFHPFADCGRAAIYVLTPTGASGTQAQAPWPRSAAALALELAAIYRSSSWRITRPLRAAKRLMDVTRASFRR